MMLGQLPSPTQQPDTTVESILRAAVQLPTWVWILLLAAAMGFSFWVYWSERGSARPWLRATLASLRFLLLFTVMWMFCGWSWLQFMTERPELAIVIDNSASMATRDTALASAAGSPLESRLDATRTILQDLPPALQNSLLQKYRVRWYSLSDTLEGLSAGFTESGLSQLVADGPQSKLGEGLIQLFERHSGAGMAAVVLFSDGINTAGLGLEEAEKVARSAAIPVYAAVVGREFTLPDVRLVDLLMDREVYFGDRVTAEVSVITNNVGAAPLTISLIDAERGRKLDETQIEAQADNTQLLARLSFVPDRPGQIPLRIEANVVEGETDTANNSLTHNLNVQDKTLKVLLVCGQPTYEFRFLKHFLERSRQAGQEAAASFELQSVLQESDSDYVAQDQSARRLVPSDVDALSQTDVFIFHNFDPELVSLRSQEIIYQAVTEEGAGCLFVYGDSSPAKALEKWPLGKLLPVRPPGTRSSSTAALAGGDFSTLAASQATLAEGHGTFTWQPSTMGLSALPMQLAATPTQSMQVWQSLPAFQSLAPMGQLKVGAQVLAFAAGSLEEQPLLVTQFAGAGRVGLQATDETFRWTSFGGSDLYHQRYWGQLLRWLSRGKLSPSARQSSLIVEPQQAKFGQPIRLEAQLGIEVKEENVPDTVRVSLINDQQTQTTVALARAGDAARIFTSTQGSLPPGHYRALMVFPTTEQPASCEFTITAPPGEQANLEADIQAMQSLAAVSRGRFYNTADAARLFTELPPGTATRLGALPPLPLWNAWWVALWFVLLITTEWLLRRHARML